MTLTLSAAFILFALPLALGAAVLGAMGMRPKDDRCAFGARAWMIGAFSWSIVVQIALFIGKPKAGPIAVIGLAATIGAAFIARRRRRGDAAHAIARKSPFRGIFGILGAAVLVLTLAFVAHHSIRANEQRIVAGDEASIWQAKARALFEAGGWNAKLKDLIFDPDTPLVVHHEDYPPMNPLLQVWTFALAGEVIGIECRWPMQASMIALVLLLGAALFRRVHPLVAAIFVFVAGTTHWSGWLAEFAYSDHLVALGFLAAIDAWLRYRETADRRFVALAAAGLAFSIWAKNEGALVTVAAMIGVTADAIARRSLRPRAVLAWAIWPIATLLCLHALNRSMGFKNDLVLGKDGGPFWRLFFDQWSAYAGTVARWFGATLLVYWPTEKLSREPALSFAERAKFFGMIPTAFVIVVLARARALPRSIAFGPVIAVLAAIAGYFIVYVGTPNDLEWHLGTSLGRVLYSIFPAMTLALGVLVPEIIPALGVGRPSEDSRS